MSDWDNTAHDMVSTNFGPPNEITVLFDDRIVTFPMSTASTLADLVQRLAEKGGPQSRQILSVTVKQGGAIGFRGRCRQQETPRPATKSARTSRCAALLTTSSSRSDTSAVRWRR